MIVGYIKSRMKTDMNKLPIIKEEYQKLITIIRMVRDKENLSPESYSSMEALENSLRQLGSKEPLPETVQHFADIAGSMQNLYARKNADYGNSFDRSLDKFGIVAAAVRIGDKMNRMESLVDKAPLVKGESMRDTLLDMASYCIMTTMWLDRKREELIRESQYGADNDKARI